MFRNASSQNEFRLSTITYFLRCMTETSPAPYSDKRLKIFLKLGFASKVKNESCGASDSDSDSLFI